MSEESRKRLLAGLAAYPVTAAVVALWLVSASAFLPLEALPELSPWGRQFVLFSQFGPWAVVVGSLLLAAEAYFLHRATGLAISWGLLMVFVANIASSALGLTAQALLPALFAPLPDAQPVSYLALAPGWLFAAAVHSIALLPLFFIKNMKPSRYAASVAKMGLCGQAVVLAGLVAADAPRYLGWR
jgi:hypothetical protein